MKQHLRLLICLLVFSCNQDKETLPILSYTISDSGEQQPYSITYSNFKNQLGNDFNTKDLSNKIVIANFFFTRCPSICPPMRNQLIDLAHHFTKEDDFLIVSHTIDPENDTISVLKEYSENTEIKESKWQFLRASEQETKAQAKQYMTNFRPYEDGTDFYHSSYVALLDKNQRIRGFYNILINEDVSRLKHDIGQLLD